MILSIVRGGGQDLIQFQISSLPVYSFYSTQYIYLYHNENNSDCIHVEMYDS